MGNFAAFLSLLAAASCGQELKFEVDDKAAAEQRQIRMYACAGIAKFWLREQEFAIERLSKRTVHAAETIKEKLAADIMIHCYKDIDLETAERVMGMRVVDPHMEIARKWVEVDWEQFYSSRTIKLTQEQEELISLSESDQEALKVESPQATSPAVSGDYLLHPAVPLTAISVFLAVIAWVSLRTWKKTSVSRRQKRLKKR